jgi:hypothetical protein
MGDHDGLELVITIAWNAQRGAESNLRPYRDRPRCKRSLTISKAFGCQYLGSQRQQLGAKSANARARYFGVPSLGW